MIIAPAEEKLVLSPDLAGTLMTPEEFDSAEEYDEEYRYELVHGVLIVSPLPLESEVGPNEFLGHLLLSYQEYHEQGKALDGTLPERFVRTRDNRRRADRVIWAGLGRDPDPVSDVPTIVVELPSKRKRDRQRDYDEKRQEYQEIGVKEYWIIDRFQRIMTVHRNHSRKPSKIVVQADQVYRTPLLPGFDLPITRLFGVADRWKRKK